jgi:hypothetical protein
MKKIIYSCLLITILLMLSGCSDKKDNIIIYNTKNIIKITIKTQPGNDSTLKSTENENKIIEIVNYINGLDLKKTRKNPDEYTGMAYIIIFDFNDATSTQYAHFGNMFFKESGKGWYEMPYNQAEEFKGIYKSLDNK